MANEADGDDDDGDSLLWPLYIHLYYPITFHKHVQSKNGGRIAVL